MLFNSLHVVHVVPMVILSILPPNILTIHTDFFPGKFGAHFFKTKDVRGGPECGVIRMT